jgi:hypothetical protein
MSDGPGSPTVEHQLREAGQAVCDLLVRKNADYGDANLRQDGRYGILVRISDKVSRLRHMLKFKVSVDPETVMQVKESEKDAWMDIAGYAIQALRFINEEETKDGEGVR